MMKICASQNSQRVNANSANTPSSHSTVFKRAAAMLIDRS
jgi:hypothetical protein